MKKFYFALVAFLMPVMAWAQEVAEPSKFDQILAAMEKFFASLPQGGTAVVVIGGVVDFMLRMVKTEKPKSIAYAVAKMFHVLGDGFAKVAELMDKVLPQRTASKK